MLLALLAAALLTQVPTPPVPPGAGAAPPPWEVAKLFFLAGDVARAVETVLKCQVTSPKRCGPMKKPLVEYQYLASKRDELTREEAAQLIAYDRQLSPTKPGKISEPIIARFVTTPLSLAKARIDGGDPESARLALEAVLAVDPKQAEAKALLKSLPKPPPAKDAGR